MTTNTGIGELDTPFLWVDLDRMEANIGELAAYFRRAGVAWRPHTKGIKIPAIGHMLMEAGAIGLTCAKLSEAEMMADAGIRDILVANQVVGPRKVARLVELVRRADVKVAVDDPRNVEQIGSAATAAGVRVGLVVEVDVGMKRAGVAPGAPAVELARLVERTPGVRLAGLMGWEGHTVRVTDPEEKRKEVVRAVGLLGESAEACRKAGLPVEIVSGGGSGTYTISSGLGVLTEIQAGGAVFCDATYKAFGALTQPSLFVRTMVTSRPAPDRIIFDAGFKTLPAPAIAPEPVGLPPSLGFRPSAEHGTLTLQSPDHTVSIGDTFDFVVGYGDATVFLHDRLVGVRNGRVEVVWPVEGRGRLT